MLGGVIAAIGLTFVLVQSAQAMPINYCAACYQYLPAWYCLLNC